MIGEEIIHPLETEEQDIHDQDHGHHLHGDQGQSQMTDTDMKTDTIDHDHKALTEHHVEVMDAEYSSIKKKTHN